MIESQKFTSYNVKGVMQIKGKYGFRIELFYADDSMKVIQKAGFKTKKEANEKRDQTIIELYNGNFIIDDKLTVNRFLQEWLE